MTSPIRWDTRHMGRRIGLPLFPLFPLLLLVITVGGFDLGELGAQVTEAASPDEPRMLQEASRREAAGDLAGAEAILRDLLERNPVSIGGVFALERVLRGQGRLADILSSTDAFLDREPTAAAPRTLKLRVLVELDSISGMRDEAERWMRAAPGSPDPYREVARTYEQTLGLEEALAVLRRGSQAMEGLPLLAVETGDVLLRLGESAEGVESWSRALGEEGVQLSAVLRRIHDMTEVERVAVRPLVAKLGAPPTTPARKRAGIQIALDIGMEDEALALAREAVLELEDAALQGFLAGVAQQARGQGMERVVLWAYRGMRANSSDRAEGNALDAQIAELAVQLGDTALAFDAQERVSASLPAESAERRRANANAIRLSISLNPPEEVQPRFDAFKANFPSAPELDGLAALLAGRWLAREERMEAARTLQDVMGPQSALERAFLALEGSSPLSMEQVMADLLLATEGLPAARATEIVQLLALMHATSPPAALLGGRAAASAHRGDLEKGVGIIREGLGLVPPSDHPPLLALGARLAAAPNAGGRMADEKVEFLHRLVTHFAEAPEAPEAMLALARHRLHVDREIASAAEILEALILTRPNSAVVPDARRELQRLRQHHPDAGGGPS